MVAAFLPLPPKPQLDMVEHHDSTSHIDLRTAHPHRVVFSLDEIRYHSARWWRNLNRGMSIFGILLIGAVVALVVVGVKQQWGQ